MIDLSKFVEVENNFEPKILAISVNEVARLKGLFKENAQKQKTFMKPEEITLDGASMIAYLHYVGLLNQVVFAYGIEPVDGGVLIYARRFERDNTLLRSGGAIVKSLFKGKSILGGTLNILDHSTRIAQGVKHPSKLSKEDRVMADFDFSSLNRSLASAINEIAR